MFEVPEVLQVHGRDHLRHLVNHARTLWDENLLLVARDIAQ